MATQVGGNIFRSNECKPGGSSGSTVSINDAQIRFLDSKSANATHLLLMIFMVLGGGTSCLLVVVLFKHQTLVTIRLLCYKCT